MKLKNKFNDVRKKEGIGVVYYKHLKLLGLMVVII